MPEPGLGRTRWRRFGVLMLASGVATGGMLAMVADGALAVGFTVSGQEFKIHADKLEALKGFAQYGTVDARAVPGGDPTVQPAVVAVMNEAKLTNLCQSVVTDLGDFGDWTLRITAGVANPANDSGKVVATGMVVDMSQLEGNAVFSGMEIGRDATTLDKASVPSEEGLRQQGSFGQQSDTLVITNLKQTAYTTTAGTFNLPNMRLQLTKGKNECF